MWSQRSFVYKVPILFGILSLSFAELQGIKKCHYGDSACILETASTIIANYSNGVKELGIPTIDPLVYETADVKKISSGALTAQLYLKNLKVYGYSTAKIYKIEGFTENPTKLEFHYKIPKITLSADYKLRGEFFSIPLNEQGKMNDTILNYDYFWNGTVKLVERNNEKYMKLENYRTKFTTSRIYFNFGNLFNGDKVLGDSANEFFNKNWKILFDTMKPILNKITGQFFGNLVSEPFSKIPYKQFFLED
ncbi:protein takeout-like isoform X2 [Lutzomyia longipalpis]|uniref:protein takeout-like isoform X2 n=1 Tax=Lutzomyia longipalpis TaxID=7200 RepID=UPI0024845068|nr:protein takeout-like isoform X2 [Lutzomyia longipalpis]